MDALIISHQSGARYRTLRPLVWGVVASIAMITLYLSVLILAQDRQHAFEQLFADRWFVSVIVAGFGTQVGLYQYLHLGHSPTVIAGVAASTGTSTTAMLACCAHHLADVLPIVGFSGAALFLGTYQLPLLWFGLIMNLASVGYLALQVFKQHRLR